MLIVLADQLGRSVGDMYAGALIPGLLLVGLYLLFVVVVALVRPEVGAGAAARGAHLPRNPTAPAATVSLLVLLAICAAAGWGWSQVHERIMNPWLGRELPAPGDEIFILSMTVASFLALALSGLEPAAQDRAAVAPGRARDLRADPAAGADLPGAGHDLPGRGHADRRRRDGRAGRADHGAGARASSACKLLRQALDNTAKLATFVLFILIGSTVFSFTFNAADGHIWVEHLFKQLPGGQIGFLIVVNLLVFVLGMFIDFFEIAFIVIPMLAPVADKMGIDLIWFGVILAMNLQTSFLTPPFGFALFYLRSVAAEEPTTSTASPASSSRR